MKFVSWNVNGLRAWHKKGASSWFIKEKPDFFCVQETKCDVSQVPEELRNLFPYYSFFNESKARKGYSGVGIWAKQKPKEVIYGLHKEEFDTEGRVLTLVYETFVLINCYFPNGGQGPERIEFKLKFYKEFLKFCQNFEKKGLKVIFCGDVNTAHTEIDLARPKENTKNTGFLPIERAWIDEVLEAGFIDTYRFKNPEKVKYSYWDMKTFARSRNVGWRIDYFFVGENLKNKIQAVDIFTDVEGSDHCPVFLDLKI
jgi:exodeoxyribonuclease-3